MELLRDSAFIELLPTNAYKVTKTPILGRDQEIPMQMWVPIKSDRPEREIGKKYILEPTPILEALLNNYE